MSAARRIDSSLADPDAVSEPQELLATVRSVAVNLMEQLEALRLAQPEPVHTFFAEQVAAVQEDVPGQPSLPIAASAGHLAAYPGLPATADESSIVLVRMDFDELGDPVFVRRFLGAEFLPLRR